jgi:hypothetical protein
MTRMIDDRCNVRGRAASDTLGEVSHAAPSERELDVLYIAPERFRSTPQRGLACHMTFAELARYLSRPVVAEAKDSHGAWTPALYRDGVRRKLALVHVEALVVDVDEGGDVSAVAAALARYRAIVHSTFSSTHKAPRCRIVLALATPVDARTCERAHAIVRAHLAARGFVADEAAKDASRVSFSPCIRPGASFDFAEVHGEPIDAAALAAVAASPLPTPPARPVGTHDRYSKGAIKRAARAVRSAREGSRHATLYREAFSLARLQLDETAIAGALLPAATRAGLPKTEAARAICDAVRARRGE